MELMVAHCEWTNRPTTITVITSRGILEQIMKSR